MVQYQLLPWLEPGLCFTNEVEQPCRCTVAQCGCMDGFQVDGHWEAVCCGQPKNQPLLVSLEVFVCAESVSLYTGVIAALIRLERLGKSSLCGKLECKNLPDFLYLNQYHPA